MSVAELDERVRDRVQELRAESALRAQWSLSRAVRSIPRWVALVPALVALHALLVARWQVDVASTLIAQQGVMSQTVGALVTLAPVLLTGGMLLAVALGASSALGGRTSEAWSRWALALILWLLSAVIVPMPNRAMTAGVMLLCVLAVVLALVGEGRAEMRGDDLAPPWWASLGVMAALVLATLWWAKVADLEHQVTRPSLAHEKITVAHGAKTSTVDGYVVDVDEGWVTLLRESNRTVVSVPAAAVKSRAVCSMSGEPTLPTITASKGGHCE